MIDFKEDYQEYYQAKKKPSIVNMPKVNYIAVYGQGDPCPSDSEYRLSFKKLEQVTNTIRSAKKNGKKIAGFEEYNMPPRESLWWKEIGAGEFDYDKLNWIAMLRAPSFVTEDVLEWAKEQTEKEKKQSYSSVELFTYDEGMSVQCLHTGTQREIFKTVHILQEYLAEIGFCINFENGVHHEVQMRDEERVKPENMRVIVRYPIRSVQTEEGD
ncbi:MAG: GyrI-like domain-containing protein [Clostridia bacterium]|nr:GyrI-like domain-containing protein [Clostridia bacterium]